MTDTSKSVAFIGIGKMGLPMSVLIAKAGYAIKESAYTIQHQKWSTEFVKDRDGRLAMAKQISSVAGTAPSEDGQALMQAAVTGQGLGVTAPAAAPVQPPYTTGVNRGLNTGRAESAAVAHGAKVEHVYGIPKLLWWRIPVRCASGRKPKAWLYCFQTVQPSLPQGVGGRRAARHHPLASRPFPRTCELLHLAGRC